jgi:hypothetical protein
VGNFIPEGLPTFNSLRTIQVCHFFEFDKNPRYSQSEGREELFERA